MRKEKITILMEESGEAPFLIRSTLFYQETKAPRPAIFMTPVLGAFRPVENILARLLCRSGYVVFVTIPIALEFSSSQDFKIVS
jgi:hypothetical protein